MELVSYIFDAEYTIRNYANLRAEADSFRDRFIADCSGYCYDYSQPSEINQGEDISGFVKVSKKEKLMAQFYLDDGDGIFQQEEDSLIGRVRENKRDKRQLVSTNQEGWLGAKYFEEEEIEDGEIISENGFEYWMWSESEGSGDSDSGWHTSAPLEPELGIDLFASYIHPCATQING